MDEKTQALLQSLRSCRHCAQQLPHEPRPVLQFDPGARILIAAQAPGRKVHRSGIPFDDASGERLRDWLGLAPETFYDAGTVAILPMAFCYPGAAVSGDRPPMPDCAPLWRNSLLNRLNKLQLTLLVGRHAQLWHLQQAGRSLTECVSNWRQCEPGVIPTPHPSPRNNPWLKRNSWFERDLVPILRARVTEALDAPGHTERA
ncbi:MAG: uracil-DNA glycosylase family protein [Wenzhouxiangellaceae bacterium]|nr:uracil-DNA glycosylase family protein [Wenzhouxiangellaceae bacterium]